MNKLITRTITFTTVETMLCDTVSCEVSIKSYTLIGNYSKDKMIKEKINSYLPQDVKLVTIQSVNYFTQLFEITEEDFVAYGKPRLKEV